MIKHGAVFKPWLCCNLARMWHKTQGWDFGAVKPPWVASPCCAGVLGVGAGGESRSVPNLPLVAVSHPASLPLVTFLQANTSPTL